MPRPRRSQATRERLLAVGADLFSRQGYSATGIKQILDAAAVPKGSFYNYFPSKEDYGIEILDAYIDQRLTNPVATVPDEMSSPLARIKILHARLIQLFESDYGMRGCMLGLFAAEDHHKEPQIQSTMRNALDRVLGRYRQIFQQAIDAGYLPEESNAADLAQLFWIQWQGALLHMRITGSTDAPKQIMQQFDHNYPTPKPSSKGDDHVQ